MAARKKSKDKTAIMACGECTERNYSVPKSISVMHERLELKKYCRRCASHTLHRETR